jgi:dUTP pyrophosphatase
MGIKEKELQMKIKIKRLRDTATLPTRESSSAAGYDLYADIAEPVTIRPHETAKIGTGIAMEIPEGYFGGVAARSGLSSKEGLRPANCYGIVDSDYRGEIIVALHNDSETARVVTPQERIGQIIIQPYLNVEFDEADELSDTERGTGGFGSTGK